MYEGYNFVGMHLVWWLVWFVFLLTIFGWYQPIPRRMISPLSILQRRLAAGQIDEQEYQKCKAIIAMDS